MIQVKEFLNLQAKQEETINNWLKEMDNTIEIIDIKYSVGTHQESEKNGWDSQEYSGVLVVYKRN